MMRLVNKLTDEVTILTCSPVEERFWAKVNRTETCWLWTGTLSNGYGWFRIGSDRDGSGRTVYAHRWSYEQVHGPIPEGLELDHLCRVRCCVRPSHLEATSHRENVLRGSGITARHARQTHCLRGHPFDDANTYHRPDRPEGRMCRECGRAAQRARYRPVARKSRRVTDPAMVKARTSLPTPLQRRSAMPLSPATLLTCPNCGGSGRVVDGAASRRHRLQRGLLQKDVAAAMSISPTYLHDLEGGRRQWNHDLLARWTAAIGGL